MWKSNCPNTICWKDYSFLIEWTWYPCKKLVISVWVYLWSLSSIPLVHIPILTPVSHCFDSCSFEIGMCESSNIVLLFQDSFSSSAFFSIGYSGSVAILYKFEDQCFHICKKGCWNFHSGYIESVDHFG